MCHNNPIAPANKLFLQPLVTPAVVRSREILEGIIQPRVAIIEDQWNFELLLEGKTDQEIRLRGRGCNDRVAGIILQEFGSRFDGLSFPADLRIGNEKQIPQELEKLPHPLRRHPHGPLPLEHPIGVERTGPDDFDFRLVHFLQKCRIECEVTGRAHGEDSGTPSVVRKIPCELQRALDSAQSHRRKIISYYKYFVQMFSLSKILNYSKIGF